MNDSVIVRLTMAANVCGRRRDAAPDDITLLRSHTSMVMGRDDCFFPAADNENDMKELDVNESEEMLIWESVSEPDSIWKSEALFIEEKKSNLRRVNEVETVIMNEMSYVRRRTVLEVVPCMKYEEML